MFRKFKNLISQALTLRHFDLDNTIVISVDSSSYGIGTVTLQKNQPVAFMSISLTTTQQRYSQIEKEALFVIVGSRNFTIIFMELGHDYTVHTDH